LFGHFQGFAFLIELINVIALSRLDGGAEEDNPVVSKQVRNSLEKKSRVLQVLCQHGGNDSLVLSTGGPLFDIKSISNCKRYPGAMS
jgi:hypothetical protein